ncbi:hypothetical protein N7456_009828 [Penicillium angulare]|uniref:Uncharacterized protein n=1 Tax=Penicillium angulare TaxID=116970 RepID=A0A9W9F5N9_9EURO|nr:hypothetical protein N7456_009828 [Penicillium angulare]
MPLNWDDDHMLSSQLRCIVTRDGTSSLHYCEKDGASGTGWSDLYPMSITTGTALRSTNEILEHHRSDVLISWKQNTVQEELDYEPTYVTSCLNNQGIWVFVQDNKPETERKTHVYMRRHGDSTFSGMAE